MTASPLLDEQWYAALTGRTFGSRAEAAEAWVGDPGDDSPHPLFEPAWLYPGGRWRRHAPDPLSFYLSRSERPARSPHPRYRLADLGPLEDWLAAGGDPTTLLPAPLARVERGETVVRLRSSDLGELVGWVRHLARTDASAVVDAVGLGGGPLRVLRSVVADLPAVHVDTPPPAATHREVTVDAGVRPPSWTWLRPLVDALDGSGAAAVQPVLVDQDHLLVAPALPGHPVSALDRLSGTPLEHRFAGVEARRSGDDGSEDGPAVLTTSVWLPGPPSTDPGLDALATATTGLRWAIDIAAGAAPIGRRWGDWHFARSLADALERLGQWVEIDHPETRGRATRTQDDVVLTLRGLERVVPQPGAVNLLWVISHPDDVGADELAGLDLAWAASAPWAARHGVGVLPQCTDATRFHPGVGEADPDGAALFVGNARGGPRPVVAAARAAGVPLTVVGTGWAEHGVDAAADRIANTDLPAAYACAGVVLNDHHADMRAEGFVSNRVLDVLAVGGRLLTDDVVGLADLVGAEIPTWRDAADLARLARPPYDAWPGPDERRALAERIVAEHSFDARAATLLAAARRLLDSRG